MNVISYQTYYYVTATLFTGYAHAPRWVPKKQSSNIFETFGYQSNHSHIISAESVHIDYYTTYLSIFC
jgi:hypothetical protein